ncbi:winged helix-turn-helix transcriptional regulator [Candidatus Bathyarchaeota archaeon]|nr:winged helix-turn-helix transcriptional regulator [Candidatus Bathyarchaeota archaeon]
MAKADPLDAEALIYLKALAHESRLTILTSLYGEPRTFQDLMKETGLAKSALSSHLGKLMEAGLAEKYQHGVYRITVDGAALLDGVQDFMDESRERRHRLHEAELRRGMARSFLERKTARQ